MKGIFRTSVLGDRIYVVDALTVMPFQLWVSLVVETHREGVNTFHQGWERMGGLFLATVWFQEYRY